MNIFLAFFCGAIAALCAVAFISAGFRARVLRHLPLRRRTYAIAALWFSLATFIVSNEGRMPSDKMQQLRHTGAVLSVLAVCNFAWDYRRHAQKPHIHN
jgi:hypothetical protein